MNDIEEEVKCLELSMRKFPKHPLLPPIEEEIIFRLHETSDSDRKGAYLFALLSLRFLPQYFKQKDHKQLIDHLTSHWEPLPFLEKSPQAVLIALAFWLAKPLTLLEIGESRKASPKDCSNAYFALAELGCFHLLPKTHTLSVDDQDLKNPIKDKRVLFSLLRRKLDTNPSQELLSFFSQIKRPSTSIKLLHIEALLRENRTKEAGRLFKKQPIDDTSPFFIPYGCYLAATKGKRAALAHFRSHDSVTGALTLSSLLPLYLKKKLKLDRLFLWEQIELLRQLILFSHCASEKKDVKLYTLKLKKTLHHAPAETQR